VSRPPRIALIGLAVLLFIAISFALARFLQTENVERDAVLALLRDQAHGDAAAMLRRLGACAAPAS
jgi:hypothetical protein